MSKTSTKTTTFVIALIGFVVLLLGAAYLVQERDGAMDIAEMSELALETCGEGNIQSVSIAEPDPGFECKAPRITPAGS